MFIISRASQDGEFIIWETSVNGKKSAKKSILIKGGAGVIDKSTMTTPNGVVTEISDEDWELLKEHSAFKRYVERGFMEAVKSEKPAKENAKKKSSKKDGGVQLTPEDFEKRGQKAPDVSKS